MAGRAVEDETYDENADEEQPVTRRNLIGGGSLFGDRQRAVINELGVIRVGNASCKTGSNESWSHYGPGKYRASIEREGTVHSCQDTSAELIQASDCGYLEGTLTETHESRGNFKIPPPVVHGLTGRVTPVAKPGAKVPIEKNTGSITRDDLVGERANERDTKSFDLLLGNFPALFAAME